MALIGNTNEEKIWNYFIQKDKIGNGYGVAGLMGNIKKESNFNPKNMQNSYEAKLGFTDETYVEAVDNNTYHGFQTDRCGFGLCQHTSSGRKTNMWIRSKETNKSIGDLEFQLDFIMWEFNNGYKTVLNMLKNATSVKEASDIVCTKYERPADQSEKALKRRSDASEEIYEKFIGKEKDKENKVGDKMGYTNSPLITYTKISPNKTSPRNHTIDCITIHCMAGNLSVETCGNVFAKTSRKASSNYGIGTDGRIAMYVEEKDRSWCSSNSTNDHRAVTIEVANDGGAETGWHVSDKAMESLIKLVADICKRNNIKELKWSTNKSDRVNHKNGCNMTVHRDFAAKACPGDYLYNKHGYIADEVNKLLGVDSTTTPSTPQSTTPSITKTYTVQKGDTLSKIGSKTGIAWKTIAELNGIKSPYVVKVGQVLKLTTNNSNPSSPTTSKKYVSNGVDYSLVFDPTYYANKYDDLKKAFGTNADKLFAHFINFGLQEGRQAISTFNVTVYKNRYADLRNAYGNNLPLYYQHYIKFGYQEGRSAV